jgi:hypothetical protein
MRRWMLLASLGWTMGLGTFGPSTIDLADVPPPARAALVEQAEGRPILVVTTRAGEHGVMVYEALVPGELSDVDVAVDGSGHVIARFLLPRASELDDRGRLR